MGVLPFGEPLSWRPSQAVKQVENPMGQVYGLAFERDATHLNLTASQGYLFSRIDGTTPWRLLREIGGLPLEEADTCLAQWIEEGLIEVVSDGSTQASPVDAASDADEPESEQGAAIGIDESQIDDRLEIDSEAQRRILEFETTLGLSYDRLLDVPRGADPKVVKRAYFKLSKEFHPDRYFRREIGSHAARLEQIFKKILEAYEILSDPDLCQLENQQDSSPETDVGSPPDEAAESSGDQNVDPIPQEQRPLSKLERLRQRMPFKIDHAAIAARRVKAQEIFRAAVSSLKAGRLSEAEANIRIAISFDPRCAEFKEALGTLRIQAAGTRATKLLNSPSERLSDGELLEGLTLLEDILIYRPHDPKLNERAARICLQLGKFELAKGYVETLIERVSESSEHHVLAGRIFRELNDVEGAVSAFEMALKLDGENLDARRALASVRLGARDSARGGKS